VCALLIVITYLYWEFHLSLNNFNTKPANIASSMGLDRSLKLIAPNFCAKSQFSPRHSGAITKPSK